jgi:hypothetical protein
MTNRVTRFGLSALAVCLLALAFDTGRDFSANSCEKLHKSMIIRYSN